MITSHSGNTVSSLPFISNSRISLRMKKLFNIYTCILALTILSITTGWGQQGFEVGGWLGGAFYFGDLNTQFDVTHPGMAGGAIGRYNFNNRLCFKLSANYGFLHADDADSDNAFERRRNINFRTHLGDLSGQFEFNFFPYIHGSRDYFYTPYLFCRCIRLYI